MRHEVRWSRGDEAQLAGKAMRLEFEMKGVVDLYSFCFADAGPD
jgi:hypothetical protein